MARRCDVTGIGAQFGNNVSHSNRKSRRRFLPNLQNVSLVSDILGQKISLRLLSKTLRSIDKNGGLDNYLLSTSSRKLTEEAVKIKKQIKKKLAVKKAA